MPSWPANSIWSFRQDSDSCQRSQDFETRFLRRVLIQFTNLASMVVCPGEPFWKCIFKIHFQTKRLVCVLGSCTENGCGPKCSRHPVAKSLLLEVQFSMPRKNSVPGVPIAIIEKHRVPGGPISTSTGTSWLLEVPFNTPRKKTAPRGPKRKKHNT